jgi:hypothetical protein
MDAFFLVSAGRCESSAEAATSLDELRSKLGSDEMFPDFVKTVLTLAMDKTDAERRMADALLSSLVVRGAFDPQTVEAGLELVLSSLEAREADAPKCVEYTAESLAHLMEDKVSGSRSATDIPQSTLVFTFSPGVLTPDSFPQVLPESMLSHMTVLVGEKLSQKVVSQVSASTHASKTVAAALLLHFSDPPIIR